MRLILCHLVIFALVLTGDLSEGNERVKRDGDFLSNLGTQINNMLGSFLGTSRNKPQQEPQPDQSPPALQQNPPVFQHQIQENPRHLPAAGKNVAYNRRVAQSSAGLEAQRAPAPQPAPPPQDAHGPVQLVDQSGKLSYCRDYPADCSYLACLAENFQNSEQAKDLKMAGKTLLDRNLRRAVMHDPMISQAACDKVGLGEQGCQGFLQLLGLVDKLDPGPSSEEQRRDPERNDGRRKREKVDYDYDHIDFGANAGPTASAGANVGSNENGSPSGSNGNGNGRGHPGASGNNRNNGRGQHGQVGPTVGSNGNAQSSSGLLPNNGPSPGASSNGNVATPGNRRGGPSANQGSHAKHISPAAGGGHRSSNADYNEFYETGGVGGQQGSGGGKQGGSGGGLGGQSVERYKPKDCKAIATNERRRTRS